MNTFVLQLDARAIQKLKAQLASSEIAQKNPYVDFGAKVQGVTILMYTSGKVVFQGKDAQQVASHYGLASVPKKTNSEQNLALIGSDEVGNGSYFGGLAVVASLVTPKEHSFLKKLGVDDSKNLTDANILQIAPLLKAKIPHKALLLSPQKYNQVVGEGKKHNAVSVKVALHNQAIFLLLASGAKPQKIVIDAFTTERNYQKYLKNEANHFSNAVTFEEKAESKYLAVAVSSIIARQLFLENLKDLSAQIGFDLPSGAGAKSDKVASQILKTYGDSGLKQTAKYHFKNTEKARNLSKTKK